MLKCYICRKFVPEDTTVELRHGPDELRVACKTHHGVLETVRAEVQALLGNHRPPNIVNPYALSSRTVALLDAVLEERARWELKPARVVERLLSTGGT